jgi:hypothetical protein
MTVSLTHAVAVAVEKFADCGPGKWWFVHHPDGFLIECALQQRAEQIAAEINAGRSPSPDLSLVQANAAEDRPLASAATNPVANVEEEANGAIAAASNDPVSREVDGADRQQPVISGFTGEDDERDVEASGGAALVIANSSPATSQGADGHPEPSSDALPAGPLKGAANGKSERAVPHSNLVGRESGNPDSAILTAPVDDTPAIAARQAGPAQPENQKAEVRAATISQRERKPLKPHCLRPEMCGGYGRKHCGPCERAAGAQAA